ncbi:hypothetical protein ACLOJK_006534 [Asimina triloba]
MPTMDVGSGQGCRRWVLLPDDESCYSLLPVSLPGVTVGLPSKVAAAGAVAMELGRSTRSRDAMAAGSEEGERHGRRSFGWVRFSDLTVASSKFHGGCLGKMENRNWCSSGA